MSEARRTSRWFGIFFLLPTFLVKNHEIPVSCVEFMEVIGIFSSTRTCDRGLVSSSAPVIVDARDGKHNPPDLYGWSVGLWHGETDPGGSSIP